MEERKVCFPVNAALEISYENGKMTNRNGQNGVPNMIGDALENREENIVDSIYVNKYFAVVRGNYSLEYSWSTVFVDYSIIIAIIVY